MKNKYSILNVLEETHSIYSAVNEAGGHPNMDYAGYAVQAALNHFRRALNDPTLTPARLESLLRRASHELRQIRDADEEKSWPELMAQHITANANTNDTANSA